jgi:hypothetical protein
MPFTLWLRGVMVGETDFELSREGNRRAGVFRPTPSGILALPTLTAMGPALLELGAAAKSKRLGKAGAADDELEVEDFEASPEGRRVMALAKQIADLELRDPKGQTLPVQSIAVNDLEILAKLAGAEKAPARNTPRTRGGDPIRYLVSATLA